MLADNMLLEIFEKSFSKYKTKNIVLYGIGVKTQAVLEHIELNFIGLMDRDPTNIGKSFFGLNVLSGEEVIKNADIIIIVSADVYFQTIFSRIGFLHSEHNIPIYFCDGTEAISTENDKSIEENAYWAKDLATLKTQIDNHDIISFDIFDTLFTRRVTETTDLFLVIQNMIDKSSNFAKQRIEAELQLGSFATLEKIYKNLPDEFQEGYALEQELELKYLEPRSDIVEALNYAAKQQRKVYLISDIYHDRAFIELLLQKAGVSSHVEILISCELGKRKSDQTLWNHYKSIIGDKRALHIGDNPISDIENARQAQIDAFHIYNPYDMLKHSTLRNIVPKVCTLHESIIMGNIISRIFASPFALSKTKGRPHFDNLVNIGYVFFAPILFEYTIWILKENIKNKNNTILYVARDGYFLEKLHNLVAWKLRVDDAPKAHYLMASRSLLTIVNLRDRADIDAALRVKFSGRLHDYLKIRFGIKIDGEEQINSAVDSEKIKTIVYEHEAKILANAAQQRERYAKYLDKTVKDDEVIAIVDPSYKGTMQLLLTKLLGRKLQGFYCNADLSDENSNFTGKNMFALFQSNEDAKAQKSNLRKNTVFFEDGILVAPSATAIGINDDLTFEYAPLGNTQKNFSDKEAIFEGIVKYFEDTLNAYNSLQDIEISPEFVDFIIGQIFGQKSEICQNIKDKFYCDSMYEEIFDRKVFE